MTTLRPPLATLRLLLATLLIATLPANAFEWQADGGLILNQADVAQLQAEILHLHMAIEAHRQTLRKGGCI